MIDNGPRSAWKRFWEKGDWWRALILAAGYFALYQLGSLAMLPFVGGLDPSSATYALIVYVIPIAFGGAILVIFALSVGWLGQLFAKQDVPGRWWMWIAVVTVLLFNVLRFASTDLGAAGFEYIATWLLAGLLIGFAEEVLTRGFVVNMMRKAGHRELTVAVVSAAIFAGLHSGNLLSGQSLFATALQIVYTFAFGICMYLALRVTGTIIAPILLHASTDPTIFLQATYPSTSPLVAISGLGNIVVIVVGLVLLIFIRGRVGTRPSTGGTNTAPVTR